MVVSPASAANTTITQPTKTNPFDSILNRVIYSTASITFEDFYPMFEVNFRNLKNYEPVQTQGCTIVEIYNVTKARSLTFVPTWMAWNMDEDPYMPEFESKGGPMSNVSVYTWSNGAFLISNGDMLRIKFKVPNDTDYESPVFELYAPYFQDPDNSGGPELYWD